MDEIEFCDLTSSQHPVVPVTSGCTPSFGCGGNQVKKEFVVALCIFSLGSFLACLLSSLLELPLCCVLCQADKIKASSFYCPVWTWHPDPGPGTAHPATPEEADLVISLLAPPATASRPLPAQELRALPCLSGPHLSKTGDQAKRDGKHTYE